MSSRDLNQLFFYFFKYQKMIDSYKNIDNEMFKIQC